MERTRRKRSGIINAYRGAPLNITFGSDYPSMPYARILTEWKELGYKDEVMEKIFHRNAERILGL